ncbi:MAG: hypothetical protein ABIJ58_01400 [Nanoarchaeota archaeon]
MEEKEENEFLNIGSPVGDFISSFLEQVSNGLEKQGFALCKKEYSNAEVELNTTETKEVGGGIKVHIFNAGGKKEGTNSQKIKIYIRRKDDILGIL